MPTPTDFPVRYDSEMRFGVVMYGGVSLAIYIYGVSQELFELACATPLEGRRLPGEAHRDAGAVPGTREVYRRLSLLASNPDLVSRYAAGLKARDETPMGRTPDPWELLVHTAGDEACCTRFVVDVIAGTSAGGINGIFLAKALARAQRFEALGQLWVDEGDIGALLNDKQAWKGLPAGLKQPGPPTSLLSSDRMYLKLLKAFSDMTVPPGSGDGQPDSPLVEELDLYVTTTDISGAPVPLRLFDKVVYERRHRQRFHFSYPSQRKDTNGAAMVSDFDFSQENHPFLAFAARCTSSFPFAFEPMTLQRMRELSPSVTADQLHLWQGYFDCLTALGVDGRPFGDGGYLDNKPFSYVAEALSQRFGDMPAQRKLLYVEPSPESLSPDDDARPAVPNAVENALSALLTIPQYETIREDLNTVLKRNRRIERVERIARLVEEDIERQNDGFSRVALPGGQIPRWETLSLDAMLAYYGPGFAPYRRLRVYAVSDWMAQQLSSAFGVDCESDRGYALRAVVRAWRERLFADNPQLDDPQRQPPRESINAFLQRHDLDYRLRRLTLLMRRVDQLTRLVRRPTGPRSELDELLAKKLARALPARNPLTDEQAQQEALAQLQSLKVDLRKIYRTSLATRRDWKDGAVIQPIVDRDPALRKELDRVIAMLLNQPPGESADDRCVRTEDGQTVDIPQDLAWLQAGPGSYSLQDSVMHRVQAWLERAAASGQKPLKLWTALCEALEATRVDDLGRHGRSFRPLLVEVWNLIGQPQLRPVTRPVTPAAAPAAAPAATSTASPPVAPPAAGASEAPAAPAESTPAGVTRAELQVARDHRFAPGSLQAGVSHGLRLLLGEWFLNFDSFDQTRYTLYFDTGTGEPATVDVVRVSPADAVALRAYRPDASKLAGTSLAHFGAFLDERWRRNDIMWGRLDGAERLIQSILPAETDDAQRVRDELIRLAQGRILTQTLKSTASVELTAWLATAVQGADGSRLQDKLAQLLEALDIRPGRARDRLAEALAGLLDADQLRRYASSQPTFDPHPPVDRTLRNAARAVTVTGRVLEGVSQSDAPSMAPIARWAARLGLILQGAMVVAVPGTIGQRIFGHLLALVYAVEAVLLLIAMLFGESGLRFAALSAIGVTVLAHLVTLLLRDASRRGHGGRWMLALLLAITVGLPALFGVLAFSQQGIAAVCGPAVSLGAARDWVCGASRTEGRPLATVSGP